MPSGATLKGRFLWWSCLLTAGGIGLCQIPESRAAEPTDEREVSSDAAQRAQLFIALLKRRAERILEAHRAPPPPLWSGSAGISEGYESNVNLEGIRKGDLFTEESGSLLFQPQVTSWLGAQFAYNLVNTNFHELTDSNLLSNTFSALFQLKPHRALRFDLGSEYGILSFPNGSDSSFFDYRFKANASVAHTGWLTHKIGWTYQLREYDTRKARDINGNKILGENRQDNRHTALYEMQLRFPKTSARIGAEYYRNTSNDESQEFYDWDDFRIRGVLTRIFSPHWIGTLNISQERKNYHERSVPAINVAERDDLLTVGGTLIYQLSARTSWSYSLTYRHQDSNDPRLDFTDWIHQLGISISF